MSIRPMDMQVMLPKLDQHFYAKQNVVNRNLNEQANFVEINNTDVQRKLLVVRESEEASKSNYADHEKHRRGEDHQRDSNSSEKSRHQEDHRKDLSQRENKNYNSFGKRQSAGGIFFDLKI